MKLIVKYFGESGGLWESFRTTIPYNIRDIMPLPIMGRLNWRQYPHHHNKDLLGL